MKPTKGFPSILFELMNTKTTSGKGAQCDKGYGEMFFFLGGFGDENFKLFSEALTQHDHPTKTLCMRQDVYKFVLLKVVAVVDEV